MEEKKKENYFTRFVKERWRASWQYILVCLLFVLLAWLETKVPLIAYIHMYIFFAGVILFVLGLLCVFVLARLIDAHWYLDQSVILRYREDKSYENYERLLKTIFIWSTYALSGILVMWQFTKWYWTFVVTDKPVVLVGIVWFAIMSSFLACLIILWWKER
ncbi:TPA: hypothetical protein GX533_03075 [Candidatus Dojkabacteria bacterium]|jgi:hypothetical protein|uniref:Uncharacterized protein n=1 Tax=Candidatus Dojkabacteria bacterium TaxID=2099670 RepID=A0A832QGN8_9BACT|nr:hypothetical protein [Candidatus Dojkabacteria bacterium]